MYLPLCVTFEAEHWLTTHVVTVGNYAIAEFEADDTKGGAVMAEKSNKAERIYVR